VALSRVWAELARRLADSVLLPFGVSDYAKAVRGYLGQLEAGYGNLMTSRGLNTSLGECKNKLHSEIKLNLRQKHYDHVRLTQREFFSNCSR
jgi:uncharacterized short protein YbdD (DUF466 family)